MPGGVTPGALGSNVSTLSISEVLAQFVSQLTLDLIPDEVCAKAKRHILDSIGVALAVADSEFATAALSALSTPDEQGSSVVIGMGTRLPLRDAVLMNAMLIHGADYDDTYPAGLIHPSASSLPTALAVGSRLGASGASFLVSYIVGIEIAARLGAVSEGGIHAAGFHPTGLLAAFPCSLAAGRLMGLAPDQLARGQGVALSSASLCARQFSREGALTKRLHPGLGAAAGILAATIAKGDLAAPRAVYEGEAGLFAAVMREPFVERLARATDGLGSQWETLGLSIKPYPACHYVHTCVDAAIELRVRHKLQPGDIDAVTALVPATAVPVVCEPAADRRRPTTTFMTQFSIYYAVACALVRGRFDLDEQEPHAFRDSEILSVADRVSYQVDPHSRYPRYLSGGVVIRTTDGRELTQLEPVHRGSDIKPFSEADIVGKFRSATRNAITSDRADRLIAACLRVDELPSISFLEDDLGARVTAPAPHN